jgi:hypothetical protein
MSKWSMRGHFRHLRFENFPMTPRTPQCKVFWPLLSNSEHSRVPEDSKSPTLGVLGFTPTLDQSGVATEKERMQTLEWAEQSKLAERCREYYMGEGVGFPPSPGRGESCVSKCPWLVPTPKGVPQMWTNHFVVCFGCRFKLDLLVPLPNLIPGLLARPSTPL